MTTDGGGWMVSPSALMECAVPPVALGFECHAHSSCFSAGFPQTPEWEAGILQELEELHSRLWEHE